MSLTIVGLVLLAFGVLYLRRPAVYRKGVWMKTSIAIRMLSEDGYRRYIKGLGVVFILTGLACIAWDRGLAEIVEHRQTSESGADGSLGVDELLAHSSTYSGKVVSVSAFATIEFEDMVLCSGGTKAHRGSCVWLEIDPGPYESDADEQRYTKAEAYWSTFNGKRVLVRGVFVSGPSGHFGMQPGVIEQIVSVHAQ